MLEFDRNAPIDTEVLAQFFARCGWREPDAAVKLEWALATSEEWLVCKLDGHIVGFGRSYRLNAGARVVFDVVVDPRLEQSGLRELIIRALADSAGGLEEVSVFRPTAGSGTELALTSEGEQQGLRGQDIYLGKQKTGLIREE